MPDPNWALAHCKGKNTEVFFPVSAEVDPEPAKRICRGCLIRSDCLEWALRTRQEFGIFGEMTEQERRAEAARRKQRTRVTIG